MRFDLFLTVIAGIFTMAQAGSLNCRVVGGCEVCERGRIALSGNFTYVVNTNGNPLLFILDVSDPHEPFVVGQWDTTRPPYPECIALCGHFAYIGVYGTGCDGIWIVDVSNPAEPKAVKHCSTSNDPEKIVVSGDFAYIVVDDGLRILNVSDPLEPYEVGHWDGLDRTEDVAVFGSLAYVAEYDSGLRILDVSNPDEPYEVGHCYFTGSVFRVRVADSGNYAYVVTGGPPRLWVVDVSNPQEPYVVGWFGGALSSVALSGNLIYMGGGRFLYVIDVSDPANPYLAGYHEELKSVYDIAASGNLIYTNALQIIEFSVVGVREERRQGAQSQRLRASPNPALGTAQISCPERVTAVGVYDALGRLVRNLKHQEGRATLSGLSAGVYLLKAEIEGEHLSTKLVMR